MKVRISTFSQQKGPVADSESGLMPPILASMIMRPWDWP